MMSVCLPAEEQTIAQEERRAEAGELLGLQRLYVCTALSNQPRGELSKPPEVRFPQALTFQFYLTNAR